MQPPRSPGSGGDQPDGPGLAAKYRSGSSIQSLAAESGRSRWWVRKQLVDAGEAIRARGGSQAGPTSAELEQLRQLYVDEELPPAKIATRLGRSTSWVGLHLGRLGIEMRRSRRQIVGAQEADVLRRYVTNRQSMNAIAKALDLGPAAVRTVLVANGIAIRDRSAPRRIDCTVLAQLYLEEGLSTPAIADRLGVSTSGVGSALTRCQIPRRAAATFEISDEALVRLYVDERLDDDAIARRFGVAVWAVNSRRRAAGIRRPPSWYTRPAPEPAELERLFLEQRKTLSQIATEFQVPQATVRRWLIHAGLIDVDPDVQRSRPGATEISIDDLERLYVDEQRTAADVGYLLGVSKRVILRNLHAHGLPVRPPGGRRPAPDQTVLEALYADEAVVGVLRAADVELRPHHGDLHSRWPQPAELNDELLDGLYRQLGLSGAHISLLTGHTETNIRVALQRAGIATRAGGRSPWTSRHRGGAG